MAPLTRAATTSETINPATQEVLAEVARGGEREVEPPSRRQNGFPAWAGQALP